MKPDEYHNLLLKFNESNQQIQELEIIPGDIYLSKEELNDCAKLLYKTQKAIAALPFIHDETNKIVHKNMRLGLGVTGVCQALDKIEWLDD